nr:Mariner Mos1 transposase [Hymenolepis microstoma]
MAKYGHTCRTLQMLLCLIFTSLTYFAQCHNGLADQHLSSYERVKNWIDSWILSKDEKFFSQRDSPGAREMGQSGQYLET